MDVLIVLGALIALLVISAIVVGYTPVELRRAPKTSGRRVALPLRERLTLVNHFCDRPWVTTKPALRLLSFAPRCGETRSDPGSVAPNKTAAGATRPLP